MSTRLSALVLAVSILQPLSASALPRGTEVQPYKGGLAFPVDMAWVPGTSKIFFTEKNTGRIRVLIGRRLLDRPCADLDVASSGERGALGIVLHPNFARNKKLYVYHTNRDPLDNRVTRFVVKRNRCTNARVIIKGISAASSGYHNGGQIEFVGRYLFVATGEAHEPSAAQDTSNRLGKILRYHPNGTVPGDNPFGNAVWSYGHRNPFGLARKPGTKLLYATENGPQCDDELNIIRRGRNYGWGPGYECGTAGIGEDPKPPLVRWSDIIVPTDPWWYRGRLDALSGDLYVGAFGDGTLHRIVTANGGTRLVRDRIVHRDGDGIVDVAKGPGGWLYYLTPTAIKRIVES